MNNKIWLALSAIIVAGISWYIYTCHIRCSCISSTPAVFNTVAKISSQEPITFSYNQHIPVTAAGWVAYKDSLKGLANAGKMINITGYFSAAEKNNTRFENLGLARADTIRAMLVPDIPANKIILRALLKEVAITDSNSTFVSSFIESSDPVKAPSADGGVVQKDDKTSLIYFPSGSAQKELNKDVDAYLVTLAEKLKSSGAAADITGHSDNKGKYEVNLKLSKDRAEQVKSILVKKGVAPARLTSSGVADKEPIGDNNTDEGRRTNRRVEIVIQ